MIEIFISIYIVYIDNLRQHYKLSIDMAQIDRLQDRAPGW